MFYNFVINYFNVENILSFVTLKLNRSLISKNSGGTRRRLLTYAQLKDVFKSEI